MRVSVDKASGSSGGGRARSRSPRRSKSRSRSRSGGRDRSKSRSRSRSRCTVVGTRCSFDLSFSLGLDISLLRLTVPSFRVPPAAAAAAATTAVLVIVTAVVDGTVLLGRRRPRGRVQIEEVANGATDNAADSASYSSTELAAAPAPLLLPRSA